MSKTVPHLFLWLLCLFFLAPFIYSFGFCYPRGDDYDGITRSMFLFDLPGALYEAGREWLCWSGRYTYHFLAVFLGKAAAFPATCGLVCALVLSMYGLAFYKLGRLIILGRTGAFSFSLVVLCILMGCHGNLQDFYLLTDALTIILQGACYFLFFFQLSALCLACDAGEERVRRKRCIFWGIIAIGVYEHAALAVFWTMTAALLLGCLPALKKFLPAAGESLRRSLFSCFLWLSLAIIFSFFAPGNMMRKEARNVDAEQLWSQLCNLPSDLFSFFSAFLCSPWPLAAISLAMLARLASSQRNFSFLQGQALAYISLPTFLIFSLSVTGLHALSDVPLLSEAKLGSSLAVYAAFSLGLTVFFLPWQKIRIFNFRRILVFILFLTLIITSEASGNFILCAKNAANGQMLLYADFMAERKAWLATAAAEWVCKQDKFGLIGEIKNPDSRRRKANPEKGEALVQSFPRLVFPVHMLMMQLSADSAGWPNLWAAWVYGLGALAELPPNPQSAIDIVKKGKGQILPLPEALLGAGLTCAWLVLDTENPNPTFHDAWLVLLGKKSVEVKILLPSGISAWRLLPLPLQKGVKELFDNKVEFDGNFFMDFFTLPLHAKLQDKDEFTAIWLTPLISGKYLPHYLFASVNDLVYHKLTVLNSVQKEEKQDYDFSGKCEIKSDLPIFF